MFPESNSPMIKGPISAINRFRLAILAATIIAIALGGWSARNLNLNLGLESRFMRDNPHLAEWIKFQEDFGAEPLLYAVWEGRGSALEAGAMERQRALIARLSAIEGVESAIGLPTLIEAAGADGAGAEGLKGLPIVKKLLVGGGGRKAIIALAPAGGAIAPGEGLSLVRQVEDSLKGFVGDGERAFVTGPLAMQSHAIEASRRDLGRAGAIVILLGAAILWAAYRSWQAIAAAILVVAAATAGAAGLIALLGIELSQFALIAMPILAAVGLEDSAYMIEHFAVARAKGHGAMEACREMWASALVPCIWTALTTMAGFAAISLSRIEQIRSIGIVVLFGAPLALVASLVSIPALFLAWPPPPRAGTWTSSGAVSGYVAFLSRHRRPIAAAALLASLIASLGILRLKLRPDFPGLFRPGVAFQAEMDEMAREMGGWASFEAVMEAADGGDLLEIQKIRMMSRLQSALSLTGSVAATISPLDIAASAYLLKGGLDSGGAMGRPEGLLSDAAQALRGGEMENLLSPWLTADGKRARVHVRVKAGREGQDRALLDTLAFLRDGFAVEGVRLSWSGLALLYREMEGRLGRELILSSLASFAAVLCLMILLFRSLRWGIASIVPNVLPIAVTLGIMGWAGVGLSAGLIILPAVGLGLIVDDTIHIAWGMRRLLRQGWGLEAAAAEVLGTSGRALILSSAMLAIGFASLAASPFASNFNLAIFMSLLILLAIAFDIAGVPVMLFLLGAGKGGSRITD